MDHETNLTFLRQVHGSHKYLSLNLSRLKMAAVLRLLERLDYTERNRVFLDRKNPMDYLRDEEIFARYRFSRHTIFYITDLVSARLVHPTRRSVPLTPLLQVLVFLRFLATGDFHLLIGESINISKDTAGRCIRRVSEVIVSLAGQCIVFPKGDDARQRKAGFFAVAEIAFFLQMVCDENFIITHCVAKCPGSVHDTRMFKESNLCRQFENEII
ncbi:hypothetical protein KUTeg_002833 [Tegillarca granosa]|uniref:DDE Tnp4 domain-containing protein n=1 Tax=Tegillarca granosa TaxID=220873 RepID=A0ABQ9FTZ0_TEGGR|nr:hypothetical protein KUTeg_002833 [Tegillarca granosa]